MPEDKDAAPAPADGEVKQAAPDLARREKAALQKIDLARSLAVSANKIFLIFFLSLALCWAQSVWTAVANLRAIANSRAQLLSASNVKSNHISDRAQRLENFVNSEKALKDNVTEARDTPFKLPFSFGSIDIPGYTAPLLWTLLTLSLLAYLNYSRRRSLSIASRALRVLIEEVKYTEREFTDACAGFPWWFVPLPRRDGQVVSAAQLRIAVGWIATEGWLNEAGRFALIFIFCLQGATCCLSIAVAIKIARVGITRFSILVATMSGAVLSLLWLYEWFRISRVPDNRADEMSPHPWGRREAIRVLAIGLAGASVVPPANLFRSYRSGRSPRFKNRHRCGRLGLLLSAAKIAMHEGASLNTVSRVIHYAAPSSESGMLYVKSLRSPAITKNFKPVDLFSAMTEPGVLEKTLPAKHPPQPSIETSSSKAAPAASEDAEGTRRAKKKKTHALHIEKRSFVWAVEEETERLLKQRPPDFAGASRLLFQAIHVEKTNPRNLRLFDRLAVLIIKNSHAVTNDMYFLETLRAEVCKELNNLPRSANPKAPVKLRADQAAHQDLPISILNAMHRSVFGTPAESPKRRGAGLLRHQMVGTKYILRKLPEAKYSDKLRYLSELSKRQSSWSSRTSKWAIRWSKPEKNWQSPSLPLLAHKNQKRARQC